MVWDLFVWLSSFLVVGGLLGIVVYQLMCLSDLEFDYVNPFEAASRINMLVIPEFGLQGCLSIFFLLTGHWVMFFINIPIIYYHSNLYLKKSYQVDVTEIFRDLGSERKLRLGKLAFYLLLFFLIIYRRTISTFLLGLSSSPRHRRSFRFTSVQDLFFCVRLFMLFPVAIASFRGQE